MDVDGADKSSEPVTDDDGRKPGETDEDGRTKQLIDLTSGGGGTPPAGSEENVPNALAKSLARLASTAGEAIQRFAFPLSLTILVLVFLLIQGEIDRRDPKLAFAPVDSSKDMVFFQ